MKRIMIVDDDQSMRNIYRDIFDKYRQDYSIEIFPDPRKAFKMLKEEKFDLVITDIIMEPMDGETFFVTISNDSGLRNLPVLVVTVLSRDELDQHFNKKTAEFLQKPFSELELLSKLQELIR